MTYYGYRFSVAICCNSRKEKQAAINEIMQISYKLFSQFTVFPRVDFGRFLVV